MPILDPKTGKTYLTIPEIAIRWETHKNNIYKSFIRTGSLTVVDFNGTGVMLVELETLRAYETKRCRFLRRQVERQVALRTAPYPEPVSLASPEGRRLITNGLKTQRARAKLQEKRRSA